MSDNIKLSDSIRTTSTNQRQTTLPIVVLIILSPVLTELLMGVVHITNLWLLIPEMGVYGFAALIIREVAKRWQRSWGTILALGIAFAIAEECVILQTSLTPQFFPPAFENNFGWAYGVQWIYLVAMLWYESVYAIVLPIYLTELLFPGKRDILWVSDRGLELAAGAFILSSIGVWQLWSRVGLQKYGSSSYEVPSAYIGAALIVIAIIVAGTLAPRSRLHSTRKTARRAPMPLLVGLMSFGFSLAWFIMIALAYIPASIFKGASPLIPIIIGLTWLGLGLLVIKRISTPDDWQDRHRLALIFGASTGSMLGGTLVILTASPIDVIGKFGFDLIALALFIWFTFRLQRRHVELDQNL